MDSAGKFLGKADILYHLIHGQFTWKTYKSRSDYSSKIYQPSKLFRQNYEKVRSYVVLSFIDIHRELSNKGK